MCGRFASARKRQELLAEFRVERDRVTEALEPDYNVAPTKPVYAVLSRTKRASGNDDQRGARPSEGREPARGTQRRNGDDQGGPRAAQAAEPALGNRRRDRDEQLGAAEPARELRVVRWGLVPSWAKDPSIGSRLINARAETVDSKPAYRKAFARRRCLLPADGFYEWLPVEEQGRKRKQPYYIHPADGGLLAFAGLYELWRDKSVPEDDPLAWLWTAVIITTSAQDEVGRIHDRMPMIIEPARWDDWLDPLSTDPSDVRSLLSPALSAELVSYPVAADVNYVRNNGPRLIEPLPDRSAVPANRRGGGGAHGGDGWLASGPAALGPAAAGPTAGASGQAVMAIGPPVEGRRRDPGTAPPTLF